MTRPVPPPEVVAVTVAERSEAGLCIGCGRVEVPAGWHAPKPWACSACVEAVAGAIGRPVGLDSVEVRTLGRLVVRAGAGLLHGLLRKPDALARRRRP